MLRFIFLPLIGVLIVSVAAGQSVFSGRVLENKTRIALHGVIVQNLNNKLKAITSDDGHFSVAAKTGDLIIFKSFAYLPDTLLLTDMHDREVFMLPQNNMLNQVTITDTSGHSSTAEKNMKYYDPEFHGQPLVYQRDENENYKGGVALRLHYFTKDDHDKKKAAELEKNRATREQIGNVFTALNISKYVPLRDEDLDNFILLYTPSINTYTSKDFNLLTYLNGSYKTWQTLSDEQRKAGQLFKKE